MPTWTKEQQEAITSMHEDILVSAAAGSGKTTVLIERILQKILGITTSPINVDELLVVTFTNASAKEMKQRLLKSIQSRLKSEEVINDPVLFRHLNQQLIKIHHADISTLHRFCLKLIEQYYFTIDLDPSFRTGSTEEIQMLLSQAIDETLEIYYAENDTTFIQLVQMLSSDRNDTGLRSAIQRMYYFAVANPNPNEWLLSMTQQFEEENMTQLFQQIAHEFKQNLQMHLTDLNQILYQIEHHPDFEKVEIQLKDIIQEINSLPEDFEAMPGHFKVLFERAASGSRKKDADKDFIREITAQIKPIRESLKTLVMNYLYDDFSQMKSDIVMTKPYLNLLVKITQEVMVTFKQLKSDRKVIDFSDYEHFALQILIKDGQPTEIAKQLRAHYHEIMIDEYQDTNRVQEAIIQSIKKQNKGEQNLFMVGDVKQSIYKFRQAEPQLFLQKYNDFKTNHTGKVIDLSDNFRSGLHVINDTNAIFDRVMDQQFGEIEYEGKQRLNCGKFKTFEEDVYGLPTELIFVDDKKLENRDADIEYIARKINQIVGKEKVFDKDLNQERYAEFRDIVILKRGIKRDAYQFQTILAAHQIPVFIKSDQGYFDTDEIRTMMSFVRIIDNPIQDIHLAGVLRSIIYQISETELAEIKLLNKQLSLYENITTYVSHGENHELKMKIQAFLADLKDYRAQARTLNVTDLLQYIFDDTHLIEKYLMLPAGKQRVANLKGLQAKADQFESSSYSGIYQFIQFIDKMIAEGKDFGEENILNDEANVVRIMTVHASKGLEFPFVIYTGLQTEYNLMDLSKPLLMSQMYGVALNTYKPELNLSHPNLLTQRLKEQLKREQVSEELRLMYVALTRAINQLILVSKLSDDEAVDLEKIHDEYVGDKTIESALEDYQAVTLHHKLDDSFRMKAKKPIDFIGGSIFTHTKPLNIRYQFVTALDDLTDEVMATENDAEQSSTAWLDDINAYEYPYQSVFDLPTKESVSEIKQQHESDDSTTYRYVNRYILEQSDFERPQFMQQKKKTNAEIGTLMHTIMQHLPRKKDMTREDINQFIDQLIERNIIQINDKSYIDQEKINTFTQSKIFEQLVRAEEVYYELPFVIGKEYIFDEASPGQVIQGMIDCVYKVDGQYYFLDYKTDRFNLRLGKSKDDVLQEMKAKYQFQMDAYKKTLEALLGTSVKGYLYFFEYKEIEV